MPYSFVMTKVHVNIHLPIEFHHFQYLLNSAQSIPHSTAMLPVGSHYFVEMDPIFPYCAFKI